MYNVQCINTHIKCHKCAKCSHFSTFYFYFYSTIKCYICLHLVSNNGETLQASVPLLSSHQHHLVRAISSSTNVYIRRQACSSNVYRFISTCLIEHPPTALGDNRDKLFEFIFHQLQPREISQNLHLGEQRCAPISQQDHCHHMTVRNV